MQTKFPVRQSVDQPQQSFRSAVAQRDDENKLVETETEMQTPDCQNTERRKYNANKTYSNAVTQANRLLLEQEHTGESALNAYCKPQIDTRDESANNEQTEFYDHSCRDETRPQTVSEANEYRQSVKSVLRSPVNSRECIESAKQAPGLHEAPMQGTADQAITQTAGKLQSNAELDGLGAHSGPLQADNGAVGVNNNKTQNMSYRSSVKETDGRQMQGSREARAKDERRNEPAKQNLLQVRQPTYGKHRTDATCAIELHEAVGDPANGNTWQQTLNQPTVDSQAECIDQRPQSYYAWNNKANEEGYNDQIIRVSACKRRQKNPLYKVHFKNKSKSEWVTINKIPPRVLSVFYVKSYQKKRKRKT
jgi:hypothetical protein